MIKAVIFDFDGVIVDSADIKTEAFAQLFRAYPYRLTKIVDYHIKNSGISRYVKFRYIYENILGKNIDKKEEIALGEEFSRIVFEKVICAPLVPGAKDFFDANRGRRLFFIASGTPEEELRDIINTKGLTNYFKEVLGSPKTKVDIIYHILNKYHFCLNEIVYVGDADSDRIAAEKAGIYFIERKKNIDPSVNDNFVIKDLSNLDEILITIEKLHFRKEKSV